MLVLLRFEIFQNHKRRMAMLCFVGIAISVVSVLMESHKKMIGDVFGQNFALGPSNTQAAIANFSGMWGMFSLTLVLTGIGVILDERVSLGFIVSRISAKNVILAKWLGLCAQVVCAAIISGGIFVLLAEGLVGPLPPSASVLLALCFWTAYLVFVCAVLLAFSAAASSSSFASIGCLCILGLFNLMMTSRLADFSPTALIAFAQARMIGGNATLAMTSLFSTSLLIVALLYWASISLSKDR